MNRMNNWWYYHKWYVLGGCALLFFLLHWLCSVLGIFEKEPDYQIAYVGKARLSAEAEALIKESFISISKDFNGDGEVIIELNQYLSIDQSQDGNIDYDGYASDVTLVGDISNCDSYFFIMDDPQMLQKRFHILALPNGACPADEDESAEDKVVSWEKCIPFQNMEIKLDELSELYIGRRWFYPGDMPDYSEECDEMWSAICSVQ